MKKLFKGIITAFITAAMLTTSLTITSSAAVSGKNAASSASKDDQRLEKIANKIVNKANKYNNTYDKLKVIHDELCKIATYDITYRYKGWKKILLEGRGVCDAYARAYEYLCKKAGLEVVYITGMANGIDGWELHAWNLAKVDGKWYYIDACWDDDTDMADCYYAYFLIGEKQIKKSHYRSSDNYPEASMTDYLTEKKDIYLNGNIGVWGEVGKTYYITIPEGYEDYKLKWTLSNDNAEIISYSLKDHPGYREDPYGNTITVIHIGIEIKLNKPGEVEIRCEVSSKHKTVVATMLLKIEKPFDPDLGYKNTTGSSSARTLFNVANPKVYLGLNVPIDMSLFADMKPGTLVNTTNQNRVKVTKTSAGYTMSAVSGSGYVTINNDSETNKFYVVACKKYKKPSYLDLKLSKSSIKTGDTFTISALSDRSKSDELTWLFSNDNIRIAKELDEKGNESVEFKAITKGTTVIRCLTSSGTETSVTVTIK